MNKTDLEILHQAKSNFSNYRDKSFRKLQAEAIQYISDSEKKIVVVGAATGAGKSVLGMVAGANSGRLTYLVHTKLLQNQITSDFPEASSLFGRANYNCLNNPEVSCGECSAIGGSCTHKKSDCPYELRKRQVLAANYRILNYDYFLSESNYVGRFSNAPFVVVDEADSLENTLINFVTLQFSTYALRRLGMLDMAGSLKMTSKDKSGLLDSWKEFGNQAKYRVTSIIKKLSADIESWGEDINVHQLDVIKERSRVVRLKEKIDLFLTNVDSDWILDNQENKLIFRPLWLTSELSEEYLWRHGKKFVLMSATFPPKMVLAKCLGIDTSDMDYFEIPSQFPVENRPVYCWPVANMTAKTTNMELPKLISAVKLIVDHYPDVKGIIHAVSYSLANKIIDGVDSLRLITHNSKDRQEVIDRFTTSDEPLVLISPSLERGISLEEDKCRFIIICKAPFLYLGDKVVNARLFSSKIGQMWYTSSMLLTVCQMAGRGVRSSEDTADTYILDLKVKEAIQKNPSFLPSWWLDALEFEKPTWIKLEDLEAENGGKFESGLDDVPF
jgi:Rad3-related DNA helicase